MRMEKIFRVRLSAPTKQPPIRISMPVKQVVSNSREPAARPGDQRISESTTFKATVVNIVRTNPFEASGILAIAQH